MSPRFTPVLLAVVSFSPFAFAQVPPGGFEPMLAPYDLVDNQQAEWTNLNLVPFRPMAWTSDGLHLYAVNVHDSTVRHFDFTAGSPPAMHEHRVPWGPVSVALYDAPGVERLLVVCRGTHALAVLERSSGEVVELVELPFEPADILVVETPASDYAFISCSGAREVVRVELSTLTTTSIPIQAIQLGWLARAADGRVLVAPIVSGNNSVIRDDGALPQAVEVFDLDGQASQSAQLPDEDLFAIDPTTLVVTAISRKAGSILFAHGVNPVTGKHWQLDLDSINKNPAQQTEPQHRGKFAKNRLTLTALPGSGSTSTHTQLDLDDANPFQTGKQPLALPTGLSFSPSGARAVAVGVGTDNAMLFSTAAASEGSFIANSEMALPNTSIPRFALFDPVTENQVAIYCWGTNKIEFWQISSLPPVHVTAKTLDLGYDPTPALVRDGRNIFYDASRSLNGTVTCGSCHIEGTSDQLAWNLSDSPADTKGPLTTQTLFGIDRIAPFHWRGERRELEDFNVAFTGLLGAPAQLTGPQMEQFKAFVLSLRSPANIGADELRLLNDELALPHTIPNTNPPVTLTGSAIDGQEVFQTVPALNGRTCSQCHSLPTGSNGDIFDENGSLIPSMFHIEVAAFNELEDKDMPVVMISGTNPPGADGQTALTGFSTEHRGKVPSRLHFVSKFKVPLGTQGVADVNEFLIQFDSGFGKVIHRAALLDSAHLGNAARISDYLIPQVEAGNGSLAVWGTYPVGNPPAPAEVAWAYDPTTDRFLADASSIPSVSFADFQQQAQLGLARNVFVGLPAGNERRAIDWDLDGLVNKREVTLGTDPHNPDTNGDGLLDGSTANGFPSVQGLQILWDTAKNARLIFRTSEPVKDVTINYSPAGAPSVPNETLVVPQPRFGRVFSVVLPKLRPSTINGPTFNYSGTLAVTDDAGNTTTVSLPVFSTEPFENDLQPLKAVIGDVWWTSLVSNVGAGTLQAQGKVRVDQKVGGPPPVSMSGYVVVANVLVDGQISAFTTTTSPTQSFKINGVPFSSLPGPFLITAKTSASPLGEASFNFTVSGLTPGKVVRLNVIGVFAARPAYSPNYAFNDPNFGDASDPPGNRENLTPSNNWSLPDTLKEERGIEAIFPATFP